MKQFAAGLSVAACLVAGCLVAGCLSLPAHAHGVYIKAGFPGKGLGIFYGIGDHFSLRTEFTTGRIRRNFTSGLVDYRARLGADQWGTYGDWFPFGNGFRISGGVHVRKLQVQAQGRPNANGQIIIHNTPVGFGPNDSLIGRVKFPAATPYIGMGWGYHSAKKHRIGFVLDVGVSFGRPSASLMISESLRKKLDLATAGGITTAAGELEGQRKKLTDTVRKLKIVPQIYAGVSWRF